MAKHKYKIGDKIIVDGICGEILNLGHAEIKGNKFHLCDSKKEVENESLLGYHVFLGRKIKIIKECDIKLQ